MNKLSYFFGLAAVMRFCTRCVAHFRVRNFFVQAKAPVMN